MKKEHIDVNTPQGALEKFSQLMGQIKKEQGSEKQKIARAALMMAKGIVVIEEGKNPQEVLAEVQKRVRPIRFKENLHLFWMRLYDCREARWNPKEYPSVMRQPVAAMGMLENCAKWGYRESVKAEVSPGMLVARLGSLGEVEVIHGAECLEAWAKKADCFDKQRLYKIFVKNARHLCRSHRVVPASLWKLVQNWSERTTGQMELPIDLANCPTREDLGSSWWRVAGVRC